MTRPILWALGVLAGAALTGGSMTERFARAGHGAPAPAAEAAQVAPGSASSVTLAQDLSGHFQAYPQVEGQVLRMLVDTGATLCVFTSEDAQRIGVRVGPRDFTAQVATANGTVPAARVRVREMRLGGIAVRDVEALVLPSGRLETSLLGMSFLRRLRGFEVAAGRMILRG
ncbi:TIGR02281 family clan AA aspartic protease [Methylobacterium currus]|uniref:TIGR02281 family clan AA aspartic protease n=1 Tax=Methylobacterium currus TaxID=2051553 RepID=A0A2R4WIG1_9HYPH|nr:TIGR02281 family clan AA aspartic protease [Methylobacterium currus]AWB21334.1 TIGR02281 family clan AA aspartic protease [Methylobacterium currus]UHC13915.1 TIGR02281 family clan AA aspartic protease [Methylobacterium currus]